MKKSALLLIRNVLHIRNAYYIEITISGKNSPDDGILDDKIFFRRQVNQWATGLAREIVLIGFQMWEHRNSIQHSEESHQNRQLSLTINEGIRSQFKMGIQDLPRKIQPMLHPGLTAVLEGSLIERQTWLNLVSQERTLCRRSLTPQRSTFRAYFSSPKKRKRESCR